MAAIDFAVQMIFLARLSVSYSSHLATLLYQASLLGGWEGAPPWGPPSGPLLPLHTSLIHSQLPLSASYPASDPCLMPMQLWAGDPARRQRTCKASPPQPPAPPSHSCPLSPPATLYSLSRQGSHTVWLAPQGWATPSPRLQALQHSPLWVYRPVRHASWAPPKDTWVGGRAEGQTGKRKERGYLLRNQTPLPKAFYWNHLGPDELTREVLGTSKPAGSKAVGGTAPLQGAGGGGEVRASQSDPRHSSFRGYSSSWHLKDTPHGEGGLRPRGGPSGCSSHRASSQGGNWQLKFSPNATY